MRLHGRQVRDGFLRKRFVRQLTGYCTKHGLDGADFDWEAPANQEQMEQYGLLLTAVEQVVKGRAIYGVARWRGLIVVVGWGVELRGARSKAHCGSACMAEAAGCYYFSC